MAALMADGVGVQQSWPGAFDMLLDAALKGSPAAQGQMRILAQFGAVDRSADADEGAQDDWVAHRRSIRLDAWTSPCEKQVLSKSPRIVAIADFVPQSVCAWLIGRASGRLRPALLYGTKSAMPVRQGVRTNSAFEINTLDTDMVVMLVKARISATIGFPTSFLEPPQILHYSPGEQFAPHRDYLDPNVPGQAADFARRGQRVVTFLVYLNSGYEGGETGFASLGLTHKGQAGGALYFGNVDPSGAVDPRTLHAGLPPASGEKWLFSQWIVARQSGWEVRDNQDGDLGSRRTY
jgi:prolyl 4-hydroxylase